VIDPGDQIATWLDKSLICATRHRDQVRGKHGSRDARLIFVCQPAAAEQLLMILGLLWLKIMINHVML